MCIISTQNINDFNVIYTGYYENNVMAKYQ